MPEEVLLLVPHLSLLWFQPAEQAGEAFGCSVAMNKSCIGGGAGGGDLSFLILCFLQAAGWSSLGGIRRKFIRQIHH